MLIYTILYKYIVMYFHTISDFINIKFIYNEVICTFSGLKLNQNFVWLEAL